MSRRLAVFAIVEAGGRHHISMTPAVGDDAGDVALGVKPVGRKHLVELPAHPLFHIPVGQAEQLHARRGGLLRHRDPGVAKRVVHGDGDRLVRVQRHGFLAVYHHLPANGEEPAVAFEPAHRRGTQFLQELPVAQGDADGVHGRVVEFAHGLNVRRRQVFAHQAVHPLAARHDDMPALDLVQFASAVIDDRDILGGLRRRAVVDDPRHRAGQTDAGGVVGPIQLLEVDAVVQHIRQRV